MCVRICVCVSIQRLISAYSYRCKQVARMRRHPRLLAVRVMLTVELCKQQQHYNKNNIFPIASCILFFTRSGRTHFSLSRKKKNLNNRQVVVIIIIIYFLQLRWAAIASPSIIFIIIQYYLFCTPHTRHVGYFTFYFAVHM